MARVDHLAGSQTVAPTGEGVLSSWLASVFDTWPDSVIRHRTEFRTFCRTYGSLWASARRAGSFYASCGLRPGDKLLVWGPNSPAWVVALLGCLASGVVAVPVDVRSRADFVRRVWRETEAGLLVRTRSKPDPGLPVPSVHLEDLEAQVAELRPAIPPRLSPQDVAEILYTSGTTGQPKGTIITHGNLLCELAAILPAVPAERHTLLSILPLSHVFEQVIGLLAALSVGATIVYLETAKPTAVEEALRTQRITAMIVVPRFLQLLRDEMRRALPGPASGWLDAYAEASLRLPVHLRRWLSWPLRRALAPDLRFFVCGGAPLDPDLERFWDGLGVPVLQGYGLTETSSAVTLNTLQMRRIGTVGRVLAGQEVRVGRDDEILVRGPNVTPGYHCRREQTAAAFSDGWFCTGDVGRFDPDGFLVLKGRLKDVIVTSAGVNVYPEDVESVLKRISGVRDSAVVEWRGHVHAVLLVEPEARREPGQIVGEANRHLDSSQQILGYTVWPYPDFPRTPAGKVRKVDVRAELPRIEARRLPPAPRLPGPVVALVAQVAHRPPGQIDSESTLGPDLQLGSIDRMELLALTEGELGIDLDEEAVTAGTTVRELERMVGEGARAAGRVRFPRWSRWPAVQVLRDLLQRCLVLPLTRSFVELEVRGLDHLEGVEGPVIFAANHTSRLDVPALLLALPDRYRRRLAPAARAEYFEAPGQPARALLLEALCSLVALAFNAFKFPQYRGFRPSLRYAGELVDQGWSILVFPEGRQTTTGEMERFKEGLGVMVAALRVPVVPVRLSGLFEIAAGAEIVPRRRGRATATFGSPLTFRHESYQEIAERVEAAVRAL